MIGYLPNGPEVWRVTYGGKIKQFEHIDKALNYMKEKLLKKHNHQLSLNRVNLQETEINETKFKGVS